MDRVILGEAPEGESISSNRRGGNTGLFISRPGANVLSCSDGDLIFDSTSEDFMIVLAKGSIMLPAGKENWVNDPSFAGVFPSTTTVDPGIDDLYLKEDETLFVTWNALVPSSNLHPDVFSSDWNAPGSESFATIPPALSMNFNNLGDPSKTRGYPITARTVSSITTYSTEGDTVALIPGEMAARNHGPVYYNLGGGSYYNPTYAGGGYALHTQMLAEPDQGGDQFLGLVDYESITVNPANSSQIAFFASWNWPAFAAVADYGVYWKNLYLTYWQGGLDSGHTPSAGPSTPGNRWDAAAYWWQYMVYVPLIFRSYGTGSTSSFVDQGGFFDHFQRPLGEPSIFRAEYDPATKKINANTVYPIVDDWTRSFRTNVDAGLSSLKIPPFWCVGSIQGNGDWGNAFFDTEFVVPKNRFDGYHSSLGHESGGYLPTDGQGLFDHGSGNPTIGLNGGAEKILDWSPDGNTIVYLKQLGNMLKNERNEGLAEKYDGTGLDPGVNGDVRLNTGLNRLHVVHDFFTQFGTEVPTETPLDLSMPDSGFTGGFPEYYRSYHNDWNEITGCRFGAPTTANNSEIWFTRKNDHKVIWVAEFNPDGTTYEGNPGPQLASSENHVALSTLDDPRYPWLGAKRQGLRFYDNYTKVIFISCDPAYVQHDCKRGAPVISKTPFAIPGGRPWEGGGATGLGDGIEKMGGGAPYQIYKGDYDKITKIISNIIQVTGDIISTSADSPTITNASGKTDAMMADPVEGNFCFYMHGQDEDAPDLVRAGDVANDPGNSYWASALPGEGSILERLSIADTDLAASAFFDDVQDSRVIYKEEDYGILEHPHGSGNYPRGLFGRWKFNPLNNEMQNPTVFGAAHLATIISGEARSIPDGSFNAPGHFNPQSNFFVHNDFSIGSFTSFDILPDGSQILTAMTNDFDVGNPSSAAGDIHAGTGGSYMLPMVGDAIGSTFNTPAWNRHYIQAANVVSNTTHGTKIIFKNTSTKEAAVSWTLFRAKVSS